MNVSLVEALYMEVKDVCLSDLHGLTPPERRRAVRVLGTVPAEAASLTEWNDALSYLTDAEKADTVEGAREQLIRLLSEK